MNKAEEITLNIGHCDLEQIAESGQCFRWYRRKTTGGTAYTVLDGADQALLWQQGRQLTIYCQKGHTEKWLHYLDIGTDYEAITRSIPKSDHYLTVAAGRAAGIRILNADLWEIMVSFIISQNNNIPRIKKTISQMCEKLGPEIEGPDGTYHGFPTPASLAHIQNLQGLGLGYRDKYIASLARNVRDGKVSLDELRRMSPEQAHTYLKSIYGIGEKVRSCIMLFGLGHKGAFPIDTWIKKIIAREYGGKFPVEHYKNCAGVIQQYMFYSERKNVN